MSTWQLLEFAYPADQICPGRMWEDVLALPGAQVARYRAFRGHFLAYLEPYLDRTFDTFTILRDPVERTISHYYHVRRSPEHPAYEVSQSITLEEFCTDPRTRHMVRDYQSGYLACPGDKSPMSLASKLTPRDLTEYKLQLALDPSPDDFPPDHELFRAAMERLNSFVAVGVTERLQQSLELISRALRLPTPPLLPVRNAGWNRPPDIDARTRRAIRAQTQVDQVVYDTVRAALDRQLRQARSA